MSLPDAARGRAAKVKALLLDVDGVLTDGRLYYGADGEALKAFDVKDGLGLRLLRDEDVHVAVISAKRSPALERRLEALGLSRAHLGREDKLRALDEVLEALSLDAEEVAYVGDDLLDLPVLARVGLSITVADAHPRVRATVDWVTEAPGGRGAVREVTDALLEARGRLDEACAALLERVEKSRK